MFERKAPTAKKIQNPDMQLPKKIFCVFGILLLVLVWDLDIRAWDLHLPFIVMNA